MAEEALSVQSTCWLKALFGTETILLFNISDDITSIEIEMKRADVRTMSMQGDNTPLSLMSPKTEEGLRRTTHIKNLMSNSYL